MSAGLNYATTYDTSECIPKAIFYVIPLAGSDMKSGKISSLTQHAREKEREGKKTVSTSSECVYVYSLRFEGKIDICAIDINWKNTYLTCFRP